MTLPNETDYLIVGAGVSGLCFADVLLTYSDKTITLVDRRHAPGGHWVDAYPFARLHQPSASYGVDSMPIGGFGLDPERDPTLYERATAAEVCATFDRLLHQRFLPSGRVRFLPSHDYLGEGRVRSLISGAEQQLAFGKRVDTTYLEGAIPATSPPPFEVDEGVRCLTPTDLVHLKTHADDYVVIGAGKTGQDAVLWLLAAGVAPEAIRWVRPRDPWLTPRRAAQPGPGLPTTIDYFARGIELVTKAGSLSELLHALEAQGLLIRIDRATEPTAFLSAIISDWQMAQMRKVQNVIRMGHVRRIRRDTIELEAGTVPTGPNSVHIHCAAIGLGNAPARTIFDGDQITPQSIRFGLQAYSMSLLGFAEATLDDDDLKNRVCVPFVKTGTPVDWLRGRLRDIENTRRWTKEAPGMLTFANQTPVNTMKGLNELRQTEPVKSVMAKVTELMPEAEANMHRLLSEFEDTTHTFRPRTCSEDLGD